MHRSVNRARGRRFATALGITAIALAVIVPQASAASTACRTGNARTGVGYKGASALSAAVAAASPGDTINVWGSCPSNQTIATDLTLDGNGSGATLDGGQQNRVLKITTGTTTIRDLTITNGKTTSAGGGIYVGSAAILDGVTVTGNQAGVNNFGGGIEADFGSSLTLVGSVVKGNTAGGSGGIDMFMAKASIRSSTVSGNRATGAVTDGCAFGTGVFSCAGGIWNYHGTLALVNSKVTDNVADYRAGGIRNDATFAGGVPTDGVVILSGSSRIRSNTAGDQGGGIWSSGRVANPTPPPSFNPFDPNGSVKAADGSATYSDPVSNSSLPRWTGSISGNAPDQCFPTLTIGSFSCS